MKKIVSKSNCNAVKETIYLEKKGVGKIVRQREKDNSGYTDVDEIDWQNLLLMPPKGFEHGLNARHIKAKFYLCNNKS